MRKILTLVIIIIAMTSYGQTKNGSEVNKLAINNELVDSIQITNNCLPCDSCQFITYRLNESMTKNLFEILNESNTKDSCKYLTLYWLDIYFKDGTIRTFGINGPLFNENNKWCFDINDSDYFENLWIELEKNCIHYLLHVPETNNRCSVNWYFNESSNIRCPGCRHISYKGYLGYWKRLEFFSSFLF